MAAIQLRLSFSYGVARYKETELSLRVPVSEGERMSATLKEGHRLR
jgi:hypothetical protein